MFDEFKDGSLNPKHDWSYTIAHRIVIEAASDVTVKGYGIYCFDTGDAEWQWVNTNYQGEPYNSDFKNRALITKRREERLESERRRTLETGDKFAPFEIRHF